jgi:hypothetical protein
MKHVLATLACVTLLLSIATGAFFIGQGTRKADAQVNTERQVAVRTAVTGARNEGRIALGEAVAAAVKKRAAHDRRVLRRAVRKLKKSGEREAARSYSNGTSVGYQSGNRDGYSSGTEDGKVQASDELVCSDDTDVYWLPSC